MKAILSTSVFVLICFCFVACGDDEQNGTDQNAPNTLESLLNPNANSATATSSATPAGSMSLNDIWVLDSIHSNVKYNVNLVNNTPMLVLDTAKGTVTGHTGCNSIDGKLKVSGNKLLIDSLKLTSAQPCDDKGFEKKLLSSLRSRNTTFSISNDKLFLNVGPGADFIYRRIRR